MRRLLLLLALSGCSQVLGRAGATLPTPPAPVNAVREATGTDEVGSTPIRGAVVRSQLLALLGKEPDTAKVMLKGYGHYGDVKVAPGPHHYDDCAQKVVCAFDQPESGMGVGDPITLYVNPGLKIAAPPN